MVEASFNVILNDSIVLGLIGNFMVLEDFLENLWVKGLVSANRAVFNHVVVQVVLGILWRFLFHTNLLLGFKLRF